MARAAVAAFAVLMCVGLWSGPAAEASDPDAMRDFAEDVSDFVLRDVFKNGVVTVGPGGTRAALTPDVFPALLSTGISYVHFKLLPCGENTPHTHPRATELLTLISGGPLQAGFVDTSGKAHIYILNMGDTIVFPRGMLHYELNVGTTTAFFVSALNSQNPGTLTAAASILELPERAAAGAFNTDVSTIQKLKSQMYENSNLLQIDTRSGCVPGQNITEVS